MNSKGSMKYVEKYNIYWNFDVLSMKMRLSFENNFTTMGGGVINVYYIAKCQNEVCSSFGYRQL